MTIKTTIDLIETYGAEVDARVERLANVPTQPMRAVGKAAADPCVRPYDCWA